MTEKIKCTLTCELVTVYVFREEAVESLQCWNYEGKQYIIARNVFPAYPFRDWAVYQVITVGNEEVI